MHTKPRIIPQSLNLTTHGNFYVEAAHDTSVRCGPHGSPRTINWEATINSKPEYADSRGFVIDWRDISKAIADRYHTVNVFPSCELFAQEICDMIVGLLEFKCVKVSVKIGIDGLPAFMVAEWINEAA